MMKKHFWMILVAAVLFGCCKAEVNHSSSQAAQAPQAEPADSYEVADETAPVV